MESNSLHNVSEFAVPDCEEITPVNMRNQKGQSFELRGSGLANARMDNNFAVTTGSKAGVDNQQQACPCALKSNKNNGSQLK